MTQRILKFRVWDKTRKWMGYQFIKTICAEDGAEFDMIAFSFGDGVFRTLAECLSYEFMKILPYIGQKDKHGKEIYEGDVLSYNIAGNLREIVIVIQGKFGWTFELLNTGFYGDPNIPIIRDNWEYLSKCKIIDNIYKNPKILKITGQL